MSLTVKYFLYRKIALALAAVIFLEALLPSAAFALTGGPSQPEVQSFEPVGTSETVDLFSGDFNYNIPLMDVGGYPINISYHAGSTADQEASWVGLGWNINPGVINRNMRGVPDDFKGDAVIKEFNIKDDHTFGLNTGVALELFGISGLSIGIGTGIAYNNYKGVDIDASVNFSLSAGDDSGNNASLGLGLTASSQSGVGISPDFSFNSSISAGENSQRLGGSGGVGLSFNSRDGLKDLSFNVGGSNTATISFANKTYTPQITMPMGNFAISFSGTLGGEIFGTHPNMSVGGHYSGQYLTKHDLTVGAYGYLYPYGGSYSILDFNRENDGNYTQYTPNLPVTNFTYDIYGVSGQGIGGTYRPYRNDVGIVHDYPGNNFGGSLDVPGIEFGAGNAVRGGINIDFITSISTSGRWFNDNGLEGNLRFRASDTDPLYEPYYFKQVGEKTADSDPAFFNTMGGYEPVRINMDRNLIDVYAKRELEDRNGAKYPISSSNFKRSGRQSRDQAISTLTADEAKDLALVKRIQTYSSFTFVNGKYPFDSIERTVHPRHHISEITTLNPDGARYVYGIPAYNKFQEEVSFAITNGSPDCSTGLVSYTHNKSTGDNSVNNGQGLDHYFSRVRTPEYAHSYLLTAVLSEDYVDLGTTSAGGAEGPSDDDLGSYTKINYTKILDDYKWRVPYTRANYNEGMKSLKNDNPKSGDDKATYIYGEKEIWYMHSIETKTHVAEFYLDDTERQDGHGVKGEEGGIMTTSRSTKALKRLSYIKLYSKEDKRKNGTNAVAIKTVYFKYDYTLCPGIENSSMGLGKLTLKEVYFTYGNSNKGRLNSYKFNYNYKNVLNTHAANTDTLNPAYSLKTYDRWGNYKQNDGEANCQNALDTNLSTAEFPYSDQRLIPVSDKYYDGDDTTRTYSDLYATAWNLSSIELPSGGIIKVTYEADDYAYVQDKLAGQMFTIVGSSIRNVAPSTTTISSGLTNRLMADGSGSDNYPYLFFKLHRPIYRNEAADPTAARQIIKDKYLKNLSNLYYRFLVQLSGKHEPDAYEYVSGYTTIDDYANGGYGVVPVTGSSTPYEYGFVRVTMVGYNDKNNGPQATGSSSSSCAHPISMQSWLFARLHLPRLAFRQADPNTDGFTQAVNSLVGMLDAVKAFVRGINKNMRDEDFAKTFVPKKSWIRLNNPDGKKQGGGHRVKKVVLSDEWKNMFDSAPTYYKVAEYGQVYDYTKIDENGKEISSGVAAYEPLIGNDENPFKQPVFYPDKKVLAPDDKYFQEEPFGESFFPSPEVGYSKVTVKNLPHTDVVKTATGSVVHEFYTAREYPTIIRKTTIDPVHKKPNPIFNLLFTKSRDLMNVSQGFTIELNDMHGKISGQTVYDENKKEISKIKYNYKTQPANGSDRSKLDNVVDVIDPNGSISQKTVGVDYDFVVDMREQQTTTIGGGTDANLDFFFVGIFPIPFPMLLPAFTYEKTRFRSAVTTKVIQKYGLIDYVEASDLGASVQTKNLLYDSNTGEVLLTEATNQYKDKIYSFNYPAHWGYDRMGMAYKNLGLSFVSSTNSLSFTSITNAESYFVNGDELLLKVTATSANAVKGWVKKVNATSIEVVDENGDSRTGTWNTIKIIRSGRRNQQSTSIGMIASHKNPIVNGTLSFKEVLDASAVEFAESWRSYCNCGLNGSLDNPYLTGSLGNWRAKKSYAYLTDRIQSRLNNNLNMRNDASFKTFNVFWKQPISGNQWIKDENNWTWSSEVTEYSPYGFELESRDALNRYSGAIYGYGSTYTKAVANNSKFSEMGVDDFEDYDYTADCSSDHFSFKKDKDKVGTTIESHTGKKSIKVSSGTTVTVTKQLSGCK